METLLGTRLKALKNEHAEVKLLLEAAPRCERSGPDAKADALLDWLYRLQAEEGDPELKFLVFTEFVPTQEMLRGFLAERGFSVVCLNGSMGMEERGQVQEAFANEARILLSTDAGGEGLNLQFCHVVINYDIPWNPMRLEQRIGRVDRIGHGNIEAEGYGRPAEGVTADVKGERVRVFSDQVLRSKVKGKYQDTIEWSPIGLPDDYLPLLAGGRFAFINQGKRTVAHGGISLEELIVPFVKIEFINRKKDNII